VSVFMCVGPTAHRDKMQEHSVPLGLHTVRQYKQFCKRSIPERYQEAREHMLKWRPITPESTHRRNEQRH
jgi:hypothetical protein